MKLICPGCRTVYRVDESKIPAVKAKTRCKKCGSIIPIIPPGTTPTLRKPAAPENPSGPIPTGQARPPAQKPAPSGTHPSTAAIGSAGRRVIAFLIDVALVATVHQMVLGALQQVLAIPEGFQTTAAFALALIYLGAGNGALAGGRTVGKHLARIRVQTGDGSALSVYRSFLRSAVLVSPLYLAVYLFPLCESGNALIIAAFVCLLSTVPVSAYLIAFNASSRQALHDLAVNSFVVASEPRGILAPVPFCRRHALAAGLIVLLVAAAVFYVFPLDFSA